MESDLEEIQILEDDLGHNNAVEQPLIVAGGHGNSTSGNEDIFNFTHSKLQLNNPQPVKENFEVKDDDNQQQQKRGQGRSVFEYHNNDENDEEEEEEYEEEVDEVQKFIQEEDEEQRPKAQA